MHLRPSSPEIKVEDGHFENDHEERPRKRLRYSSDDTLLHTIQSAASKSPNSLDKASEQASLILSPHDIQTMPQSSLMRVKDVSTIELEKSKARNVDLAARLSDLRAEHDRTSRMLSVIKDQHRLTGYEYASLKEKYDFQSAELSSTRKGQSVASRELSAITQLFKEKAFQANLEVGRYLTLIHEGHNSKSAASIAIGEYSDQEKRKNTRQLRSGRLVGNIEVEL